MGYRTQTARPRRVAAAALAALALAALAACSGRQAGQDSSVGSEGASAGRAAKAPMPAAPGGTADRGAGKKASLTPSAEHQLLTYTATLTVKVADFTARLARAERIVRGAGGYVASQQQGGDGDERPTATTTFHVPAVKYRDVLDRLSGLGDRTALTRHTENVTAEVADVGSRVKSAEAALARLRTLLNRATDVDDVLAIESAVDQRESDLEAAQARQRALATQVRYATVTLKLTGPRPAGPPQRGPGFLTGLHAGWAGLVAFGSGLLTALGAALPFAMALAVIGGFGYGGWRLVRRLWRRRREQPATGGG